MHVGISSAGGDVNVDIEIFNGLAKPRRISRKFSINLPALLQAYVCSQLRLYDDNVLIYQHDDQSFHVAEELLLKSGLPYAIWVRGEPKFTWRDYHLISSARARFCFEIEEKQAWDSLYVFDCDHVESKDGLHDILSRVASQERLQIKEFSKEKKGDAKNVLLISYYAPPSQTVAVNRLKYWHDKLPEIAAKHDVDMNVMYMLSLIHI